jgi:hypothetical protein
MTRYRFAVRFAFALVALLGLAVAASRASAGEQVPFKGTFDAVSAQTPIPPVVHDEITGEGQATHLGRFDVVVSATVDLATRTGMGTYTFVAANGDTLTATFTGASQPTATPGVFLITENATITGGTGRFAGATGGFVVERLFEPATHAVTGRIAGTVSSPGANKR